MIPIMLILAVLGVGMVIYAVFGVWTSGQPVKEKHKKSEKKPNLPDEPGKEQIIQRLQKQVSELEGELIKAGVEYEKEKSEFTAAKEKEVKFSEELKRREEWVAKAEAGLAKVKSENSDLSKKFITKEEELQEEFTKNVNFSRELRELKSSLEAKEIACRLKEDQIQAQKHQIEEQLKSIKEHLAAIAEFNRKEKISEWVPKAEFNKLNEEYSRLEKDLDASQERLKSFAEEIAHLRKAVKKEEKIEQVEEIKQIEGPMPVEEAKPVEVTKPPEENIEKPEEQKEKEK